MQEHEKGVYRNRGNIPLTFNLICGKGGECCGEYPWRRIKSLSLLLLLSVLISPVFITHALGAILTVQLNGGTGTGSVNSSPSGPLSCSSTSCTGDFTSVTLSANPSPNSFFSGWGGACAGMENCSLYVALPTTVSAVFTLKSSALQVGGSYYGALQKACDNVAAGGTVMAVARDQLGDLTLDRGINLTIRGGYNDAFSLITGVTKVNGTVSLETGSTTVENIAIGQSASSSPIAPPANIIATPGNSQAGISWDPVPGATSYSVYYSTATGVTRGSPTRVIGANANTSQSVSGLTNGTTYYFVVTAVGAGGESMESAQVITTPLATATSFSQADLTGNWYFIRFASGSSPGWMRGTATTAANGAVTINSILDSSGNHTPPPAGTITWIIDSRGVVTQSGTNALDPGNHGVMAANKQIIVGNGSSSGNRAIYVCVKQGVTTFTNSDLTSKSFAIHALENGLSDPSNKWLFGNGHTDGSNRLTIDHLYEAPNKEDLPPPANFSTLSVNSSSGIVSFSPNEFNFEGIMTPDKKNMFITFTGIDETFGTHYAFMVIQMPATSYSLSDVAGIWRSHALVTKPSKWEYGAVSINGSGVLTNLEHHDSDGGNDPSTSNVTVFLNTTSGKLTTSDSSYDGQVSFDKKMVVITQTVGGTYSLTIALKP